jgi:hypothetical protein
LIRSRKVPTGHLGRVRKTRSIVLSVQTEQLTTARRGDGESRVQKLAATRSNSTTSNPSATAAVSVPNMSASFASLYQHEPGQRRVIDGTQFHLVRHTSRARASDDRSTRSTTIFPGRTSLRMRERYAERPRIYLGLEANDVGNGSPTSRYGQN